MASPAPRSPVPFVPVKQPQFSTLEERMLRHAYAEARREVEALIAGGHYEWQPFSEEDDAGPAAWLSTLRKTLYANLPAARGVDENGREYVVVLDGSGQPMKMPIARYGE